MLDSVCWTATKDVYAFGGIHQRTITNLSECQNICINDDSCVAIVWEPESPYDEFCFTLTSTRKVPTTEKDKITHYALDRNCLSEFVLLLCCLQFGTGLNAAALSRLFKQCTHFVERLLVQVALLWQMDRATRLSVEILQLQNIPIVWHYLRDPTFSRFYTIPECDRHTNTEMDG